MKKEDGETGEEFQSKFKFQHLDPGSAFPCYQGTGTQLTYIYRIGDFCNFSDKTYKTALPLVQ